MAITATSARTDNGLTEDKWGKSKVMMKAVTITGTYATGGFTLSPSAFGLKKIHSAIFNERSPGTTAYLYYYDVTTSKVRMFDTGTAADGALNETVAATNIGTRIVDIVAIGWAS